MKGKYFLMFLSAAALVLIVLVINQNYKLRKAHSTFENYYIFRGCSELITRTENDATCKLASGKIIKMVKFRDRWYLENDLPLCIQNICF